MIQRGKEAIGILSSMVMLDYDFDTNSDVFSFDAVFYAEALKVRLETSFAA